jgi:hypothetical protein
VLASAGLVEHVSNDTEAETESAVTTAEPASNGDIHEQGIDFVESSNASDGKLDDVEDSKIPGSESEEEQAVGDSSDCNDDIPVARVDKLNRFGSGKRPTRAEDPLPSSVRRPPVPIRPVRRRKPQADAEYVSRYGKHFPEWKHVFSVAGCELGGGVGDEVHKSVTVNIKERKSHLDTAVDTATNCVVEACHLLSVARSDAHAKVSPSEGAPPQRYFRVVQHKTEVFKIVTDCLTEVCMLLVYLSGVLTSQRLCNWDAG